MLLEESARVYHGVSGKPECQLPPRDRSLGTDTDGGGVLWDTRMTGIHVSVSPDGHLAPLAAGGSGPTSADANIN